SPVTGANLNDGQIHIIIENQDTYFLPSESFLIIRGIFNKSADLQATLVNNAPMFLFREIKYDLGTKTIERIVYPGHAMLMKGLLSYSDINANNLIMGWTNDDLEDYAIDDTAENNSGYKTRFNKYSGYGNGNLSFLIPLKHIFSFCEDYQKV